MNYCSKAIEEFSALATVSAFDGGDTVCEYNIIVRGTDRLLSTDSQIDNILKAADYAVRLLPESATVIFRRFMVSDPANMPHLFESIEPTDSVVGQPPLDGTKIAVWIYCATSMDCGSPVDHPHTRYARHNGYEHLWAVLRQQGAEPSQATTERLLGRCIEGLQAEGCTLADNCLRTWFFVHDIDVNYPGVVKGRNCVFSSQGLTTQTHFIASTGINGNKLSPAASYVCLDAYSAKGIDPEQITYLKASDYLNPTAEYGVAFERGTAIVYGDRRHVLISGTASINNRGEVLYHGDVVKQAERMLQNVEALVTEGGCQMTDLTHIIVYLRDPADYIVVHEYFAAHYPKVPTVIVWAPVCRPGWLIEVECSAINTLGNPRFASL